jgi:hypothetical protein
MAVQSLTKEEHVQRHSWRYQIMKNLNLNLWRCKSRTESNDLRLFRLKSICVSFNNIIIFVNYLLISCILNFCFVLSFVFLSFALFLFSFCCCFCFCFCFFLLFFYIYFLFFKFRFFIIWYLQLCLWTCSSFVNDCTAIIWYAGSDNEKSKFKKEKIYIKEQKKKTKTKTKTTTKWKQK